MVVPASGKRDKNNGIIRALSIVAIVIITQQTQVSAFWLP